MAKTILDFFRKIFGKRLAVFICSMIPIVELRGAIPLGAGLGLSWWENYILCVVGNMLPIPFILLLIKWFIGVLKNTKKCGKIQYSINKSIRHQLKGDYYVQSLIPNSHPSDEGRS